MATLPVRSHGHLHGCISSNDRFCFHGRTTAACTTADMNSSTTTAVVISMVTVGRGAAAEA